MGAFERLERVLEIIRETLDRQQTATLFDDVVGTIESDESQSRKGSAMEQVRVAVGSTVAMNNGRVQQDTKWVSFAGELVYAITDYHGGDDTRGVTQSLYKTDSGRLVVYVEDWSRWQGEADVSSLIEVSQADLGVGGRFEKLGAAAGYGRDLTLDEALAPQPAE